MKALPPVMVIFEYSATQNQHEGGRAMKKLYRHFCGIDVHLNWLQVHIIDGNQIPVITRKIKNNANGVKWLIEKIGSLGDVLVIMEASDLAFPLFDALVELKNAHVVVTNPVHNKAIAWANVKTDKIDARILAELGRGNLLSECYVPEQSVREFRALVRTRKMLSEQRTEWKNRIHGFLRSRGIGLECTDWFGKAGMKALMELELSYADRINLDIVLKQIVSLSDTIGQLDGKIKQFWQENFPQTQELLDMPGFGDVIASVVMASVGTIKRFGSPKKFAGYTGLTPSVHQSGEINRKGRITKTGPPLLRWALTEAANSIARSATGPHYAFYTRLVSRGISKSKAKVAVARKLASDVWFALALGR
jgi:transposase